MGFVKIGAGKDILYSGDVNWFLSVHSAFSVRFW